MLALEMFRSLPRTVAGRAVGGRMPGILSGYAAPLRLVTIDEPRSTGPGWARLRPGCPASAAPTSACCPAAPASTSPPWSRCRSCPATRSSPSCSTTARTCRAGTRVVVDPVLTCAARGVEPCEACATGATNRCARITVGPPRARPADRLLRRHRRRLGPAARRAPQPAAPRARGLLRRAGGADRAAGVRRAHRAAGRGRRTTTGCWSAARARSGCFATLALRELTDAGEIIVVAKHAHQRELAREFGASRGGRAGRGAAPGTPLDRRLPAQARVRLALPARRGRRRRRRRRQQAVARDRAARHPRRRAGGALRHAGRGRPLRRLVPRARGRRHLRVGPARGALPDRRLELGRPTRRRRSSSPRASRRYPLHRWREALDHAHSPAGSARSRWPSTPGVPDESPRIRPRGGRPHPAAARPRGRRLPAGELPARHPGRSTRPSRCRRSPTSTQAIGEALLHPLDMPTRCPSCCSPGMRLTIAFDDISLPLPPMRAAGHPRPDHRARPDPGRRRRRRRRRADRGQRAAPPDDGRRAQAHRRRAGLPLVLPAGPALQPRRRGPRQPRCTSASPSKGEDVEINKRAAESDLLVYVNVNLVAMDGGHKSVADRAGVVQVACGTTTTPRRWCTRARSWTTRTPRLHHSAWRMGRLLASTSRSSRSRRRSTTTSSRSPTGSCRSASGSGRCATRRRCSRCAAGSRSRRPRLRHKMFHDLRSDYGLTGVNAGEVEAVHERTIEAVHRQQLVEVQGQSDVLVMGVPFLGPYNVNSSMNPILATCMGAGLLLQLLPRPAGRAPGRRGDPLPPAQRGLQPAAPPELRRLLRGGPRRVDRPGRRRGEVRAAVRHRPLVHPPVPDLARLPRRAPVLHVVLGGARDGPRRRRHLGRRRPQGRGAARASGRRRRSRTRWRWRPATVGPARRSPTCTTRRT